MGTEFASFSKIPRLNREIVITEKIDGTNAQICITEDGEFLVGSKKKWITPKDDHFGFAKWAYEHKEELMELGVGSHYGEWWGQGIQRGYGIKEKRFSLFNVGRWTEENTPQCCHVVPIIKSGLFNETNIQNSLNYLKTFGSFAVPGYMNPEGIIIYHTALDGYFKVTLENDDIPKKLIKGRNNK